MKQDKSKLKITLYNAMLNMRYRGGVGGKIYWLMEDVGIRIAVSRFFNWKNNVCHMAKPTSEMEEAKRYFMKHKKEIKYILSFLSDEESKKTFVKILKFRQTMNPRDLPQNSYRSQYFGNHYFKYNDGEIFVDCGAFDGDAVRKLKKVMKQNGVKKYKCICFEPDERNCKALQMNHPDAICHKAGVWNCNENLYFRVSHGDDNNIVTELDSSEFADDELVKIPVQSIDETEDCRHATFIKMDIEGAEQEALIGAKETIRRNVPKLAISIYHSNEDMIKIPMMIHEFVPEYKLYIKHHSNGIPETVLYATI